MYTEFKVTNDILASSGQRIANLFIDRIIFYAIFFVIGIVGALIGEIIGSNDIIAFLENLENINPLVDVLITTILYLFMYFILEATTQRTIAKYISKTKVVLENGEKPNANEIMIRSLCRLIPFEPFSFLGNILRGWHDSLSKTYVVDVKKFNTKKSNFNEFENIGKSENEIIF